MKSLADYSMSLPEAEYHAHPAWSYSLIAKYARNGFSAISTIHKPATPSQEMEFGSLVDTVITRPDDVFSEYAVSDMVPPPAEKKVLDELLGITDVPFASVSEEELKAAIETTGYQKAWKYDTQYKHLVEYAEYYDIRRTHKKVISTTDWMDALDIRNAMKTFPLTNKIFGKNKDNYYQLQFLHPYTLESGKTVDLKVMFDLLKVNHKNKTIRPVDLKTSSLPAYDFPSNFVRMRYDIQASLYPMVLRMILDETEEFKDYTILPFLFVDISRTDKVPIVYEYDSTDESQISGLSFGNYTYKGWETLLDEILSYEETSAKVPSNIRIDDTPNNLIELLNS